MKEFEISSEEAQIGTAWGGPIYLRVPSGKSGQMEIHIKGALPMAVYTGGLNGSGNGSVEEFKKTLEKGAPMAILKEKGRGEFHCMKALLESLTFISIPGRVSLSVPADAARNCSDPEAVVAFWTEFHKSHMELNQDPEHQNDSKLESHWVFDNQVGYGYANCAAMYPQSMQGRCNYPIAQLYQWVLRKSVSDSTNSQSMCNKF